MVRQNIGGQVITGIHADARLQQAVVLVRHVGEFRRSTGKIRPFGQFPFERAVDIDPTVTQPVVVKIDRAGGIQDGQSPRTGGGQDHVVETLGMFVIRREPHQRGVAGAIGDHRVVEKPQDPFPVAFLVAAVPAVVQHLSVFHHVVLDQYITIDEGPTVRGIGDQLVVVAVDQIQGAITGLDPVVPDHGAGRAVLEIVALAAGTQGPELVELKGNAQVITESWRFLQ